MPMHMPEIVPDDPEEREALLLEFSKERSLDSDLYDLEECWKVLQDYGIYIVFRTLTDPDLKDKRPFGNRGYASLFTVAFGLCAQTNVNDNSVILYERVIEEVNTFFREKIIPALMDSNLQGLRLMSAFAQAWENSKLAIKWVQRLFRSIDTGYVKHAQLAAQSKQVNSSSNRYASRQVIEEAESSSQNVPTLISAMMANFKKITFDSLHERMFSSLIDIVNNERNGDLIDQSQLKSCVEVIRVMGICDLNKCRDAESVPSYLNRRQELSIYTEMFEEPFLAATTSFYDFKMREWSQDSVPDYLIRVERAFKDEYERCMNCFDVSTEPKLMRCCVEALLNQPQLELLHRPNSGVMAMLRSFKYDDLSRMYTLFSREGADHHIVPMSKVFEEYVTEEGQKIIDTGRALIEASKNNAAAGGGEKEKGKENGEGGKKSKSDKSEKEGGIDGTKLITDFINLYNQVNKFIVEPFQGNLCFHKAMTFGFQKVFNENVSSTVTNVEHLAAYVDAVLRGKEGNEKLDERLIEQKLDESVCLFNFIVDKDIFKEMHKTYLSKRLLNSKIVSMDMERHIITRLKMAQGTPFTQLIESMITDFDLVKDGMEEFKQFVKDQNTLTNDATSSSSSGSGEENEPQTEAHIYLLTREFWPTHKSIEGINLAPCLKKVVDMYEMYFHDKHSGKKKLDWKYTLGDAEVRGYFPNNTYLINVSTLQALALYHIGQQPSSTMVSTAQVAEALNIDMEYVKRVLHSLSCGRIKVLLKTGPGGKKVDPKDEFEVNKAFKSPKLKFTIPMASLNFSDDIKKKVTEDRSIMIEAAIVRIMKARKRMTHSALVSEVLQQLNQFQPDSSLVKKRIAALIEREYLERNENADGTFSNEYNYLA